MSAKKSRPYGKLREIIERQGGTMRYERKGTRHGAWEISLNGKFKKIEAMGDKKFPDLDCLYVPLPNVEQKTWDDYEYALVPDTEERILALLV